MKDYISLSCAPCSEDCVQVGTENYKMRSTKEMEIYISQLKRDFPEAENNGCTFGIKWFDHDFGKYGEVYVFWDTDNEIASSYIDEIEELLPEYWDDKSKEELAEVYNISNKELCNE